MDEQSGRFAKGSDVCEKERERADCIVLERESERSVERENGSVTEMTSSSSITPTSGGGDIKAEKTRGTFLVFKPEISKFPVYNSILSLSPLGF